MSRPVTRVAPEAPVVDAAALLVEHGYSALPVVEDDRLVGSATEADMVEARTPAGEEATAVTRPAATVGEVMTRDPVCRTPDSNLADRERG